MSMSLGVGCRIDYREERAVLLGMLVGKAYKCN